MKKMESSLKPQSFQKLESNAKEQEIKYIIANRTDGFGERMSALLNAMYIAKNSSLIFKFIWQNPPPISII
ncbi:MAG: hypothetical protein K2P17_00040 [Helicobacteraceae bacterium]|nr:hypothetical protein [Helicobacteraceae bacterium]